MGQGHWVPEAFSVSVSLCVRSGCSGFGEPWGDLGVSKLYRGGKCVPGPFVGRGEGGGVGSRLRLLRGPATPPVQSPEVPPALLVHPPQPIINIIFNVLKKCKKGKEKKKASVAAGQKSLFPLSQEAGSECVGEIGDPAARTIEPPPEGKGNCVKGPGRGPRLTSPPLRSARGINLVSCFS